MEKEFQSQFFQKQPPPLGGGEASSFSLNDAYVNGFFPDVSFRSLLTYSPSDPAAANRNPLKMPKIEPLSAVDGGVSAGSPPYNFISEADPSSLRHHQLPNLLCYEPPPYAAAVESPDPSPRSGKVSGRKPQPPKRRRVGQKLSEKTRCLQKLLPRNQKMDIATVLEEAYKYIRFLEAQISVLRSMPFESGGGGSEMIVGVGDLGKLNRQQLLQVVVNSPVAQTQLYSSGCCLYSVEQMVWLKNAERNAFYHQMMLDSSNPNPNLNHGFTENDGRGSCSFF